jgi:DNA-binding response OmpR family regulator
LTEALVLPEKMSNGFYTGWQGCDREVELPAREFSLLEILMQHPGQVISREQLLKEVWGYDYDPGTNIVDVYIGYLRKRLGIYAIETVRGVGYRLQPLETSHKS